MKSCNIKHIDDAKIKELKDNLPNEEIVLDMAGIFSAMSDSTRAKILYLLINQELCVCNLQELTGMSQSSISHHLRILKNLKLVKFKKNGKRVYYSLQDNHIKDILRICEEHVMEEK